MLRLHPDLGGVGDPMWGPLDVYLSDEQILARAKQAGRRTRMGHMACASDRALGWWTEMTKRGKRAERDSAYARYSPCVRLRAGLLVTVLDTGAADQVYARVYSEAGPLHVWMDSAAVGPTR